MSRDVECLCRRHFRGMSSVFVGDIGVGYCIALSLMTITCFKAKQKSWFWGYTLEKDKLKSSISRQWFTQNVFKNWSIRSFLRMTEG